METFCRESINGGPTKSVYSNRMVCRWFLLSILKSTGSGCCVTRVDVCSLERKLILCPGERWWTDLVVFEEGNFCLAHVGFNTVSHATKSRYVIAMKKDFLLQMRCLGCVELFLFMVLSAVQVFTNSVNVSCLPFAQPRNTWVTSKNSGNRKHVRDGHLFPEIV